MNLKQLLTKNKGFYVFPILVFVLIILFLKVKWFLILIMVSFLFLRIFFLKQKEVTRLCIYAFILGVVSFYLFETNTSLSTLEETVITVKTFPDSLKIDGDLLTFEGKEIKTNERLIVSYKLKSEEEKAYFTHLTKTALITGKASTQVVEEARNLNAFNYAQYLELKRVSQKVKLESLNDIHQAKTSFFMPIQKIREIRRSSIVHNNDRFAPLTSSYMNALLFGFKENSPENFQLTWQSLGVAHLFSLSGMHIYFFLFLFEFILLSLMVTEESVLRLTLLFTLFLIIVTGASVGMMRAGIQYLTKKLNRRFSFKLTALDCWSLALFINMLFDPYVLLTVGGQLTYYLTFLIIFIQPLIQKINGAFQKGLAFNLLLSWLSLPLIWYYFYEWNLLNFILNILISPLLFSLILPMLLISFILSYLPFSLNFLWLEKLLTSFQSLGDRANRWDFFQQVTGKIPLVLVTIVIISQLYWLIEWEKGKYMLSKKSIFLFSLSCFIPFWKFVNPIGMIAFVDVGQGDAVFVQLPFHQGNYLYDTGGRLNFLVEEWQEQSDKRGADYTIIPFMKSRGVKMIDTVFISHAHEDHFGDLDRIGESIKIKNIYFGQGTSEQKNFRRYLEKDGLKSANTNIVKQSFSWQKNGLTLNCLYPFEEGDGQNNDSLVLKLDIKDQSILFMGDLEKAGEDKLLKESSADLEANILKVGHHGSKTSSQMSFLEEVQPDISVISCGKNNRYNHPSQETLINLEKIGTEVYRTDTNGMIYFTWHLFSKSLSKPKIVK